MINRTLNRTLHFTKITPAIVIVLCFLAGGGALRTPAAEPERAERVALPDRVAAPGGEWAATGPATTIVRAPWSKEPTDEILTEYGLRELHRRNYRRNGSQVTVEIFSARQTAGAYGLWTFLRRQTGRVEQYVHHGKVVIRLAPLVKEAGLPADVSALAESLPGILGESDRQLPVLPAHLPHSTGSGMISGSEVYLVGPQALARDPEFGARSQLIDYSGLPEVVTADYQTGNSTVRLLLAEFHTPQSASDHLSRWQGAVTDSSRVVRRIGNYIAELAGTSDPQVAESILGQIKYEQKVFWAGRKISDIPLEYRPLDPAVLREATRTGSIIVRSLIWVGVMLLLTVGVGLLVGGIFFYWRRFRQHQAGLDNRFSDGGGSIVLNLHDED